MSTLATDQIVDSIKRLVALQLWGLGAIKINLTKPYKLVSGNFSPIYVNCRQLISSPSFVDLFAAAARIICESQTVKFDVIAGGETAGIPFASFLAHSFGKPMIYVRKQAKEHGIASRIEGNLPTQSKVLLVEDLITDAGSKLSFIEAIRESGCVVQDVLVVFDRLQGGGETLAKQSIRLHRMTDINIVIEVARSGSLFSVAEIQSVQDYLSSPKDWHSKRNIPFIG